MEPDKKTQDQKSDELINLVVARLESMPANISVSIGGTDKGSYTIKELVERVKKQDEVGQKMIEMQLNYIRSLGKSPAVPARV